MPLTRSSPFVLSLRVDGLAWRQLGAFAASYMANGTGFGVYQGDGLSVSQQKIPAQGDELAWWQRGERNGLRAASSQPHWRVQWAVHIMPADCVLSPWGDWTACSRSCVGGEQRRYRHVAQHATAGGRACPPQHEAPRKQWRSCNGNVACVGRGGVRVCGGTVLAPQWRLLGGAGALYARVHTRASGCIFGDDRGKNPDAGGAVVTPVYVASLVGSKTKLSAWTLAPAHAVARARHDSFDFVVWHPRLSSKQLQHLANSYRWSVSWVAGFGGNSGIAPATAWRPLCADAKSVCNSTRTFFAKRGHAWRPHRSTDGWSS